MTTIANESPSLLGTSANKKRGTIVRRKEAKKETKNLHMVLKGKDVTLLDELRSRVFPHTQTEVVISSMQLFEELLREYDEGATFYIKRVGDKEPIEYRPFE